ncbi:chitinase-3-like protein 2 [Rhipicephalus microplus]|uniref:chitinase-3-like protein 2 n=1 Tax=Rhipicephalus microplus TaxID=6941 RepID=UPI003F6C1FD9
MTLAVPMVIFLLPYIRISLFVSATTDDLGQQTTSKLSPNPSTKPLPITLTASLRPVPTATIITAPPKPDACLGPSPDVLNGDNLTDLVHNFYPNRPSAPPGSTQPIYCIYNVSRFRRPNGYSFLPMHLPMSLCPNIVYWSWRLSGGNMSSRAKVFDKKYGLSVIGQAARDQGSSIDIILTIGGFPEDSADFHRVHDDEITQQRLIQSVYATILQYNLSGINLHWVQNDDSCERSLGDGVPRLEEFVIKLRALLAINGRSRNFSISTFVDPRDSFQMEFFRALGNQVNITFFRMHDLAPLNDFDQFCGNSIQTFQAYIQAVTPYFRPHIRVSSRPAAPPPHVNKLCISFSLALYARQGFSMNLPSPPQPVTATAGYIGLFEVCDSQLTFKEKVKRTPGCLARRTSGVLLNVAFVFEDVVTLRAKMSMLGPKNVSCALVYDIDFDNFRAGCYGSNDYLMLQHFYSARQNTSKFNISAFLP